MADNPTFVRHNGETINFQLVGEYDKYEDKKIKIIMGAGGINIWEFDSSDDRDNAIKKINDIYLDTV